MAHPENVVLEGSIMLEKSVGIVAKAEMICRGVEMILDRLMKIETSSCSSWK